LERLKHKGAALVQRSEPTLWAPVPHRDLWADSAVTWRRPAARSSRAGEPDQDRLAVVVGDGTETVLADLGRDRPEGMWTHHPAVALLAAEHLRKLG
jgi:hypothetical protein